MTHHLAEEQGEEGPIHAEAGDDDELARIVRRQLELIGEDPARPGLARTPLRVAASLRRLTDGYGTDPCDILARAMFPEEDDDIVLVRDIRFYSLCEHHLLPFFGRCHVAYLPSGRVVGLSKIARLVDIYSHRLQVQERLTRDIAKALQDVLGPRGVGVVIRARHLCMEMRGVEKSDTETVSSCMLGTFRDDARSRAELMSLLHSG